MPFADNRADFFFKRFLTRFVRHATDDAMHDLKASTDGVKAAIVSFVAVPRVLTRPVGFGIDAAMDVRRRIRARS